MSQESDLPDACAEGDHVPEWDSAAGETVCERCGRTAAEIVNELGHSVY